MSDAPKSKCHILCVDDHHDTSAMLQLLLAEEDYEVKIAATIKEACDLAASHEFDLYVLDKRLPDGSGLDLCSTLTALTPSIPCIFYSGDAYEIDPLALQTLGKQPAIAATFGKISAHAKVDEATGGWIGAQRIAHWGERA